MKNNNHIAMINETEQEKGIESVMQQCIQNFTQSVLTNTTLPVSDNDTGRIMCPAFFDRIMCWPNTLANTTAVQPCPSYYNGFNTNMNVTRVCTETGNWFINPETKKYWTNYSLCATSPEISTTLEYFIFLTKMISTIGYSVSFSTLVVAFIIMLTIKKLHCPRNKLHMHLFASFILRAGLILLKHQLFEAGVALSSDIEQSNGKEFFSKSPKNYHWLCKLMISLWQFSIMANYSWILMEGLYLHNLIYRALFADSSRNITHYIALGWGLPILFIIPWIIVRTLTEDHYCWTTHNADNGSFLIIQTPIVVSILINFILFIKITIVIYSKLQAPVYEEARRYQKWARSTLVLVPLFGIHYAVFLGLSYFEEHEVIKIIWLVGDQLFASFQGFFVSVLYCFLNTEVRTELKPHFHSFLTYCATSECLKHCFPCRDRYLRDAFCRSARGRTSVCTTMSCSSLYNNGIGAHRNSRTKWDIMAKNKTNTIQEKSKDHACRPNTKSWQDMPTRWSKRSPSDTSKGTQQFTFSSNRSIAQETMLCFEVEEKCRSEPMITEEIGMLPKTQQ